MVKNQISASQRTAAIEYAIRDVVVPATALEKKGHSIIKLNIGDPLAYKGFSTPEHMVEAYITALRSQNNGYTHSYGLYDLREAIALEEQNKENGGWPCHVDDVYVTTGVTEGLQTIFACLLEPGDTVLVPGPYYPPYMTYPPLFDGQAVEYRLDSERGWRINLDDLQSKLNDKVKIIVLVNPNNPTGGIVREEDIKHIIELLSNYPNCTLISDEIYDLYNFNGTHYSTASLSKSIPVITLNGVSKVYYAPGWRLGYMAIHDPEHRLKQVVNRMERLFRSRLCPPTPAQYGYLAGLTGPKEWMQNYRSKLLKRRDYSIKRINEITGVETEVPDGSFYMFPKLLDERWSKNDKQFVLDFLHQEHVLLVHGSGFSKEYGSGHFRLVFLPEIDTLKESFNRLNRFLN